MTDEMPDETDDETNNETDDETPDPETTPARTPDRVPRLRRAYVPPTASRVIASTAGMLPASVLATAAVARLAPLSQPARFGLAYALWIPIWIACALWAARARSATRAWLFAAAVAAVSAVCVFALPH
jgi:hypothetical protein